MGTGYTRNDTPNNIADGNVINASDLDGEFDAVQAAFNGSTGHSHDGTTGEGPQIATAGLADNAVTTAKITDANVTTAKIADSNVTTAKINNGAVTSAKLDTNIQIAGTLGVTGETTLTTHLNMGDNDIIKLGDGADLQIYHQGSASYIDDVGTGSLNIRGTNLFLRDASDNLMAGGIAGGEFRLYYDGATYGTPKLVTTATGIEVTGNIANASGDFTLDVAGQINLDADSGNMKFRDGGVDIGLFTNDATNFVIRSEVSDKDLIFKGNDGGSFIEAMRIDMSAGGNVGIGTSSPNGKTEISSSATGNVLALQLSNSAGAGSDSVTLRFRNSTSSTSVSGGSEITGLRDTSGNGGSVILKTASTAGTMTQRLRITSDGNVGIGTDSPSAKLSVSGNIETVAAQNRYLKASGWISNQIGQDSDFGATDVGMIAKSGTNLCFVTAGSEAMRIDSSGNVGIGTSSPGTKLTVDGNIYAAGTVTARNGADNQGTSLGTDGNIEITRTNGDPFIDFKSSLAEDYDTRIQQISDGLTFQTGGDGSATERMRIDSSGRLLINNNTSQAVYENASAVNSTLQINNSEGSAMIARTTGSGRLFLTRNQSIIADSTLGEISFNGGDGTNLLQAAKIIGSVDSTPGSNDMPGRLQFYTTPDGTSSPTERMRIDSSGNVGIGVTSPSTKLDVDYQHTNTTVTSPANGALRLKNTNGGADNYFTALAFTTSTTGVGTDSVIASFSESAGNSALTFWTDTSNGMSEKMRIDSSGRVGIGYTNPEGALHIDLSGNGSEAAPHLQIGNSVGYSGYHWLDGTAYYIGQDSAIRELRLYSGAETSGVVLGAGGTSWSSFSDERLKKDIEPISNGLQKLADLRCVSYRLKDVDAEDSQKKLGIIAQDLVDKVDEVIDLTKRKDDETEYMSVRYTEMIPVLIKAIQELKAELDSAKARITALENGE